MSEQIKTRNELPSLLNDGIGVEIGVERGEFSEIILKNSNLKILYSVDSWKEMSDEEYQDINNHNQKKHNQNKAETEQRLSQFGGRSKILCMTSEEASKQFEDNSIDFIYIDANHSYEGCKKDIELWFPKVAEGCVISGHDYIADGIYSEGIFGVQRAVDEFILKYNLKLSSTDEPWSSWYCIKK
jgi:hypothetical protein